MRRMSSKTGLYQVKPFSVTCYQSRDTHQEQAGIAAPAFFFPSSTIPAFVSLSLHIYHPLSTGMSRTRSSRPLTPTIPFSLRPVTVSSRRVALGTRSYATKFDLLGDKPVPANKQRLVPSSGCFPQGFKIGGVHAGIKPASHAEADLVMVTSPENACTAAAVLTRNDIFRRVHQGGPRPSRL